MDIITAILVFIMIWWSIFFIALPFWRHKAASHNKVGHDSGAPSKLHLIRHVLVTSAISIVLLLLFLWIRETGWISFHSPESFLG
ncbi:MAG: DUF1467 family protein [Pseudomonadota bacterium]